VLAEASGAILLYGYWNNNHDVALTTLHDGPSCEVTLTSLIVSNLPLFFTLV